MSSELIRQASEQILKAQVRAAEHIRDCARCRLLFEIAYEETDFSDDLVLSFSEKIDIPNPLCAFFVTSQIIRELRLCPDWPKGS